MLDYILPEHFYRYSLDNKHLTSGDALNNFGINFLQVFNRYLIILMFYKQICKCYKSQAMVITYNTYYV